MLSSTLLLPIFITRERNFRNFINILLKIMNRDEKISFDIPLSRAFHGGKKILNN